MLSRRRHCLLHLFGVLVLCGGVLADELPKDSTSNSPPQKQDTIRYLPLDHARNVISVEDSTNFESRLIQRPTPALFKSFVLPGWGQLGNQKRFKAGLFFGLQVVWIGAAVHFDRQADDFKNQWQNATDLSARNNLYSLYDNRRGRRNGYIWFAAMTAFLAGFDAYVDAHLSGAPYNQKKMSMSLDPDFGEHGLRANLTIRF